MKGDTITVEELNALQDAYINGDKPINIESPKPFPKSDKEYIDLLEQKIEALEKIIGNKA